MEKRESIERDKYHVNRTKTRDAYQRSIYIEIIIVGGLIVFVNACGGDSKGMGDVPTDSASYSNTTQSETVSDSQQETTETDRNSDLPNEWAGAELVEHYISRNLDQWDKSTDEVIVGAAVRNGNASLVIGNDRFFMEAYYEVYQKKRSATECDILIQFGYIDIGTMPFYYDKYPVNVFRAEIKDFYDKNTIRVFRRDNTEYRNDAVPRMVGETVIQADGDCLPLVSCNSNADCPYLDLEGEYRHKCQSVPGCSENKCAWDDEVEWLLEQ